MITTSLRFKLFLGYVITGLNIALPLFVLFSTIRTMPDAQLLFFRWFAVQPIFTVLNHLLHYASYLIWFWFLYKNRTKLGSLKVLGISMLVVFGFLIHGAITIYIQSERLFQF